MIYEPEKCLWYFDFNGDHHNCMLRFHALDRYHHSWVLGFYEFQPGAKHVTKTGKRK